MPRKSIKIESETDVILSDIKKKYKLHSRDEVIRFLRSNIKSNEELLTDDLKPLKEHLEALGRSDIYEKVSLLIHPLTLDPRFAKALVDIKFWYNSPGSTPTVALIKGKFREFGIEKFEDDRFLEELKKEIQ